MPSFFIDDNAEPLVDPSGMRPCGLAANIISATLTASTQELALPQPVNTSGASGDRIYMLTTDAQGALFAIDGASQGANYTGITNMVRIPPSWIWAFKANSTDTKIYVLQSGAAGVIQVALLR